MVVGFCLTVVLAAFPVCYRPNRYRVRTQFDVVVMMLRCLQCVGGHHCVTCTLNREISISWPGDLTSQISYLFSKKCPYPLTNPKKRGG